MGLDIGEESIATFSTVIERAATIVWNGPVGVFEFEKFAVGSKTVLETIVIATEKGATSIIGEIHHLKITECRQPTTTAKPCKAVYQITLNINYPIMDRV